MTRTAYLIVQIDANSAGDEAYRTALDEVNHLLGGADTRPEGGGYVVNGAADNVEPLRFVDPTLQNANFLIVETLEKAYQAQNILKVITNDKLHSWVFDAKKPAKFYA